MIKQLSENRTLKKITMSAGVVVMGIGLAMSLSSFEDPYGEEEDPYAAKKQRVVTYIGCTDFTATPANNTVGAGITITTPLGNMGASYSGSAPYLTSYAITFPKETVTDVYGNETQVPMQFASIDCPTAGTEKCTAADPCITMAKDKLSQWGFNF